MENALIIFVRNAEKGKVKSRLAKDVGDDKALQVYKYLLQYTRDIAISAKCSHFVFYSDYVHVNDVFDDDCFTKFVQEGDDLGERMMNAFTKVFGLGCKHVCIIGSDCVELQTDIINDAFEQLANTDIVLGPTTDGGYYLLGMKETHTAIFIGKAWGTSTVYDDTMESIKALNFEPALLPTLNDVDTIEDLLETNILTAMEEEPAREVGGEL